MTAPPNPDARPLCRVVIKEEFVALTGNYKLAIVLAQLEYWQRRVREFDAFLEEEAERTDGEANVQPRRGWIYKGSEELARETLMGISKQAMREHLKALVQAGWVKQRVNPDNRWDRTFQYRLDLSKMAKDLRALGYVLQGWTTADHEYGGSETEHAGSETEHRGSETERRDEEFGTAIPESTSETTSRDTVLQTGGADEPPPPTTETSRPVSAKNFGVARLCQFRREAKLAGKDPAPLDELFKRRFGDIYAAHLSDGHEVSTLDPALRYMVRAACGEGTGRLEAKKRWVPLVDAVEHVRSENQSNYHEAAKRLRSFEVPHDENTKKLQEEYDEFIEAERVKAMGPNWRERRLEAERKAQEEEG